MAIRKKRGRKRRRTRRGSNERTGSRSLLYISSRGVLLSADDKKNIYDFYMSMVDDLAMFNAYPWGSRFLM